MTTRAVILLSGGMDSATLLHYVKIKLGYAGLQALTVGYGQKHYARELACAVWQAHAAGVSEHRTIDLAVFGSLIAGGSALTDAGVAVPDLAQLAPGQLDQPPTYVPHRNLLLLALAAAAAEARGIGEVFYGAQKQDQYGYWDCTREFLDRMNAVLALNRRPAVTIRAPFLDLSKSAVLKIGFDLGVDFLHTWSCYRGGEKACGSCPTCMERRRAFESLGRADPLEYER